MTNETPPAAQEIEYDAFVSYTGSGSADPGPARLDREVAERLIRLLETYRSPRPLVRQGRPRRLRRVFRDRDELAAASDLEASLIEPLRRSRFLIVVCSPRARSSRWVNQEVATFTRLRGEDHILTLLIEGEPGEAFPPALARQLPSGEEVLPLGADIRATTRRRSLGLLKSEKLRLLAPILGCRFDDLRQREQERSKRRIATVAAGLFLLCVVLTSLTVSAVLARAKAERRYQLALESGKQILPLVLSPPDALQMKMTYLTNGVTAMQTLCDEDPRNAECVTQLLSLQRALAEASRVSGEKVPAGVELRNDSQLQLLASLNRLRAWSPGRGTGSDDIFGPSLDHDAKTLRQELSLWDRAISARIVDAVAYAEKASLLLQRLDTTTPEGLEEARRVLRKNLEIFNQVRSSQPLIPEHEELRQELRAALHRAEA